MRRVCLWAFFLCFFLTLPALANERLMAEMRFAISLAERMTEKAGLEPWASLVERLVADGFDRTELERVFIRLDRPPSPLFMAEKTLELAGMLRLRGVGLAAPPELAASFAPPDYTHLAGGMTASAGRAFINRHKSLFDAVHKRWGVQPSFVVAVMMVETGLGSNLGRHPAVHALGSMAVTDSLAWVLPQLKGLSGDETALDELIKARSDWAYNELKALLRHGPAMGGGDVTKVPGSVYGAVGLCQFMPSNIPVYGVDGDGDGRIDLFTLADAAHSIGRYLSSHGWRKAVTPVGQVQVLRSYNHSDIYASTVYGVAMQLSGSPSSTQVAQNVNIVTAARANARSAMAGTNTTKKPAAVKHNFKPLKLRSYNFLMP